ncbi:MAG: hypothetical protein RBS19_09940, partial [Bacteroidales bacterium]|nr:hypothetical protein [Bacteroidales bacterium]
MKVHSIITLRKELLYLEKEELLEICLKLTKFSTANKEYLSYLLFYSGLDSNFISEIKLEISSNFDELNSRSAYLAKKTLRKIIRLIKKYSKYSSAKEIEIELRIHFCQLFKQKKLHQLSDKPLQNIFEREINKIEKLISMLHEDLQHDYQKILKDSIL